MKTTTYFEEKVLPKRPQIQRQWCARVVANPMVTEVQSDGRVWYWGIVPEMDGRVLRVVTLEDGETIHNAFFRPQLLKKITKGNFMKLHYYPDTDTLSIRLKDTKSVSTEEIADDVVLDFDTDGNVISIDIDLASKKLDLTTLEMVNFPETLKSWNIQTKK